MLVLQNPKSPRRNNMAACIAALFVLLALPSCNGGGGSSDSSGATYTGGNTQTGSNTSASAASSGSSARDILEKANSGSSDALLELVAKTGGGSSEGTQQVRLSAADIGLGSGGYVVMTVTGGGVSYSSGKVSASSDGYVYFDIPLVASGSKVTVSISVYSTSGSLRYSGSKTQTVTEDGSLVSVELVKMTSRPLSEASVGDIVLSNGMAISPEDIDEIPAGVTAKGVVISDSLVVWCQGSNPMQGIYVPPSEAESLASGYGEGWRLPTIEELESIYGSRSRIFSLFSAAGLTPALKKDNESYFYISGTTTNGGADYSTKFWLTGARSSVPKNKTENQDGGRGYCVVAVRDKN